MARRSMLAVTSAQSGSILRDRMRARALPLSRLFLERLEERQLMAVITVNTASDGPSAGSTLSLRQAIEISNGTLAIASLTTAQQALVSGGLSAPNTIDFDISGSPGSVYDIALLSPLPAIASPVVIDGYSQPGASPNTNGPGLADNAVLNVEIDGAAAGSGANGLVVSAGASTIEGLVIANFGSQSSGSSGGNGIVLQTAGSNLVAGNFLGTNPAGTSSTNIAGDDVLIELGSSANTVGGLTPNARNLFVNNNAGGSSIGAGVDIEGTSDNLVVGNFIGTNAGGTHSLDGGTNSLGVLIAAGATNNTVGGSTATASNLISGNKGSGVQIGASSDVTATSGNVVAGNDIGTDVTGLLPLGNGFGASPGGDGVDLIGTGSTGNTIGGSAAAAGNVISANAYDGIYLDDARNDALEFNRIGTDAAKNLSDSAMGNADLGIELDDAPKNTISQNLIASNRTGGMALFYPQTTNVLISNNEIILNDGDGILFCSCGDGGSAIYGNLIGTDRTGTINLGNTGYGVDIGSSNNTVGGTSAGAGNVIAFNSKAGVGLDKLNTDIGNLLSGNSIYSNETLGIDLGESGAPLQNNSGSAQVGPNDLENYPVLASASTTGHGTTISGSLTSLPLRTFTIQFFSNPSADNSGYGQGETYVGSTTVTTDSGGHASFTYVAPSGLGGQMLSATAIDPSGNTSEFAKSIHVTTATPVSTTTVLSFAPGPLSSVPSIIVTAEVSAADGSLPTGNVVFYVNGQAAAPAISLTDENGQEFATFTTTLTSAGTYQFEAKYEGDSTHSTSVSNTLSVDGSQPTQQNPPPSQTGSQPIVGPEVVSVKWLENRSTATTIVLQFSQPLDPGPARATGNYSILTTGADGLFGRGSKRIAVKSAVYNSAADTVTLHVSRPLKVTKRYQLTLKGTTPGGLAGAGGIMLDAKSRGGKGVNVVTVLDRQDFFLNASGPSARSHSQRELRAIHERPGRK